MGDEQSKPEPGNAPGSKLVSHEKCQKAAAGVSNPQDPPCAICLDCPHLILMPCCGNVNSSTRFCIACIETYCDGGVANCPKCRKPIVVKDGKVEVAPEQRGRCRLCCQPNKVLVAPHLCDPCNLGRQQPLTYICNRCG